MFSLKLFQSEFSQFMDSFLTRHEIVKEERERYALTWWDKQLDTDELKRFQTASITEKAYPYIPE